MPMLAPSGKPTQRGTRPRDGVTSLDPSGPDVMAKASHRAHAVERGIVDLVEAVLLQGREGETFDAVVIDDALVQLREPAVRGRIANDAAEPGSEVTVRLDRADPAARTVEFSVAA